MMNPQHGIDAVEVSSGKIVWSATDGAKPLLLNGDLLVAQADGPGDVIPIALLGAERGNTVLQAKVGLPKGVTASIDESLGTSFLADARMSKGKLIISWSFSARAVSGVTPRQGSAADVRKMQGAARIDLKSGSVEPLKSGTVVTSDENHVPERISKLVESGRLPVLPRRAGSFFVLAEQAVDGGAEHFIVRRWNAKTGQPLSEITLPPGFKVVNPSADGRYFAASKVAETDATGWPTYLWAIYRMESGDHIAEIKTSNSAAPFLVWRSFLVYESRPFGRRIEGKWIEEPLELRAIDTKTGSEVWKRPLRDTEYRGPLPPTR
jgi:hypothetical protein